MADPISPTPTETSQGTVPAASLSPTTEPMQASPIPTEIEQEAASGEGESRGKEIILLPTRLHFDTPSSSTVPRSSEIRVEPIVDLPSSSEHEKISPDKGQSEEEKMEEELSEAQKAKREQEMLTELEGILPPLDRPIRRSGRVRRTLSGSKLPQTSMEHPIDIEKEERQRKAKALAKGKRKLEEGESSPGNKAPVKTPSTANFRSRKLLNPVIFEEKFCMENNLTVLWQWLHVQGWTESPLWTNAYQVNREEVIEFYNSLVISDDCHNVEATVKGRSIKFDVGMLGELMRVPVEGYENYVK